MTGDPPSSVGADQESVTESVPAVAEGAATARGTVVGLAMADAVATLAPLSLNARTFTS